MPISTSDNSHSVSNTEYSLPRNANATATLQTDACVLQVFIDWVAAGIAAGDSFQLKVYRQIASGTKTDLLCGQCIIIGAQSGPTVTPTFIMDGTNGYDVTLTKLAGTDRTVPWSLTKVT